MPDGGVNVALQQNLQNRGILLATAPRMRKKLGTYTTSTLGDTTRIKLLNVGILTRLVLLVEVNVTIGTATATASARAPYNALQRVRLTDFDGTDRINASGFQLFMLDSIRERCPYGINNEGLTAIETLPFVPTAVSTDKVRFLLDVPVAFDPESDLRGSILAQTAVGEMFLSLDWISSLYTNGAIDSLYSGGATSTVALAAGGFQVTVFQEFLLPQNGALPVLDLMTVYEYQGSLNSTDNLAAGTEKLISYPNVRTCIGAYLNYVNNNGMSYADLTSMRVIANGNNVLREYTQHDKVHEQRRYCNGDLKSGAWFELSRARPIETALYGNVQLGFTPANFTSNSSTRLEIGFENFFPKGSALPGLQQTS